MYDDLREEMRLIEQEQEALAREHYPSLHPKRKRDDAAPQQQHEEEPEEKRAMNAAADKNIRLDYTQELKCPICLDLVSAPVLMCKNEHLFCGPCLDELVRKGCNRVCPTCKDAIPQKPLRAPRLVDTLLQRVPLRCIYDGCPQTSIPKLEYEAHKRGCPHSPAVCPNADYGCAWKGKLGALAEHRCEFLVVRLSAEKVRAQLDERYKRIAAMQVELDRLHSFVKAGTKGDKFDALSHAASVTNHSIKLQFSDVDEVRKFDWYGCKFAVGLYAYEREGGPAAELFLRMLSSEDRSQDNPLSLCARVASRSDADDAPTPFVLTHGLLAPPVPRAPLACKHASSAREADSESARGVVKLSCKCAPPPRALVPCEMRIRIPERRGDRFPDLQRLVPHMAKLSLFFKLSVFIEPEAATKKPV